MSPLNKTIAFHLAALGQNAEGVRALNAPTVVANLKKQGIAVDEAVVRETQRALAQNMEILSMNSEKLHQSVSKNKARLDGPNGEPSGSANKELKKTASRTTAPNEKTDPEAGPSETQNETSALRRIIQGAKRVLFPGFDLLSSQNKLGKQAMATQAGVVIAAKIVGFGLLFTPFSNIGFPIFLYGAFNLGLALGSALDLLSPKV